MSRPVGLMPKEDLIARILASPVKKRAGLNLALAIASVSLHGAETWDGEDYDSHYLRVMNLSGTQSPDKMAIAILHDVVEDTGWTLEDLRRVGFSARIVAGVDALSKREGEQYFDFIERCSLNPDAIDIKLADLKDNMSGSRNDNFLNDWQLLKQRAYVVSYQYLVAVKKGDITPGSAVKDFMENHKNFKHHMDLYGKFSAAAAPVADPLHQPLDVSPGPA